MSCASALRNATIPSLGHTAGLTAPGLVNRLPAISTTGMSASTPACHWFQPPMPIRYAWLSSRAEPETKAAAMSLA